VDIGMHCDFSGDAQLKCDVWLVPGGQCAYIFGDHKSNDL